MLVPKISFNKSNWHVFGFPKKQFEKKLEKLNYINRSWVCILFDGDFHFSWDSLQSFRGYYNSWQYEISPKKKEMEATVKVKDPWQILSSISSILYE